MRRSYGQFTLACTALCAALIAGCASGRNVEILESRLTAQQDKLLEAERELAEARREIQSLQDTLVATRKDAARKGRSLAIGPQPAKLAFHSLLTGGIDEDGQPGDEAIRAIIQPVSEDGGVIRSEGRLDVELLDVTAPSDRRVKGHWSYAGQDLRELWASGLFSTGFNLKIEPQTGNAS